MAIISPRLLTTTDTNIYERLLRFPFKLYFIAFNSTAFYWHTAELPTFQASLPRFFAFISSFPVTLIQIPQAWGKTFLFLKLFSLFHICSYPCLSSKSYTKAHTKFYQLHKAFSEIPPTWPQPLHRQTPPVRPTTCYCYHFWLTYSNL